MFHIELRIIVEYAPKHSSITQASRCPQHLPKPNRATRTLDKLLGGSSVGVVVVHSKVGGQAEHSDQAEGLEFVGGIGIGSRCNDAQVLELIMGAGLKIIMGLPA